MRPVLWSFDSVRIDLEERDVSVKIVHGPTLVCISVEFRITEIALQTSVGELRRRVEHLARQKVLDLASFLENN